MKTQKVIMPKGIKVGMVIRDKFGHEGVVVENMHPWGFKRLQYHTADGFYFTVINHPDKEWYRLVK